MDEPVGDALGFVHRYQPPVDPDAPVLLLLHGTGGSEDDLVPLARLLCPDAGVLSPRGQVSERGMPRFFRRLAEGVFDIDDLIARAGQLHDFVGAAAERYGFPSRRLVAVGFSNGANIAAAMLLLRGGPPKEAILLAPMVPLEPERPADLAEMGVFIGAGRHDPIAPPAQAQRLATLLGDAGAAVSLRWHPGGHALTPELVAAARGWLRGRPVVGGPTGTR